MSVKRNVAVRRVKFALASLGATHPRSGAHRRAPVARSSSPSRSIEPKARHFTPAIYDLTRRPTLLTPQTWIREFCCGLCGCPALVRPLVRIDSDHEHRFLLSPAPTCVMPRRAVLIRVRLLASFEPRRSKNPASGHFALKPTGTAAGHSGDRHRASHATNHSAARASNPPSGQSGASLSASGPSALHPHRLRRPATHPLIHPVAPAFASACPACRAVSLMRCRITHRRLLPSPHPDGSESCSSGMARTAASVLAARSRYARTAASNDSSDPGANSDSVRSTTAP